MEKKIFKVSNLDLNGEFLFFNVELKQTINNIGLFSDGELFNSDIDDGDDDDDGINIQAFIIRHDIGFDTINATCNEFRTSGISGHLYYITCNVFAVGEQMYFQGNPYIRTNTNNYYLVNVSTLNRQFAISSSANGIITEINEITNC